jgi:hypothetical protein
MSSEVETSLISNSFIKQLGFLDFAALCLERISNESGPPHLPVFQEIAWNFLQKTRRPLKNVSIASA